MGGQPWFLLSQKGDRCASSVFGFNAPLVIEQGSVLIITVDNRFNESDCRRGMI